MALPSRSVNDEGYTYTHTHHSQTSSWKLCMRFKVIVRTFTPQPSGSRRLTRTSCSDSGEVAK